ncbi:hypothetical protein CP02DC14_2117A, partial [Chlamydia psittaci 02DC14]
MRSDQTGP